MSAGPDIQTLSVTTSSLFLAALDSVAPTPPESARLLIAGEPLPPVPSSFPATKLIPNSRFVVDGFRAAGDFSVSYFLSHFHSDHYGGLAATWRRGVVFCSDTTARLLIDVLNVPGNLVFSLVLGKTINIDGWDVTTVDANHCPGAVQFLFNGPSGEKYIHTGDFRFHESMKYNQIFDSFIGSDAIFLDTTYCNPKYAFPSQDESVDYVVSAIKKIMDENSTERVLFLIATYVVGKERILLEVSRRCGCLIHVDSRKMSILSILGLDDEKCVFTEESKATNVHVIGWNLLGESWPYFRPNFVKMKEIMMERGYSKAVGFVATGWMYETKKKGFAVRSKDSLEIHLVPYSEHSSYDELREYVKFLRPKRVIPTVGADIERLNGKNVVSLQKHFSGLVDETASKHDFLMAFHQKLSNTTVNIDGDIDVEDFVRQEASEVTLLTPPASLLSAENLSPESGGSFDENKFMEAKKELCALLPLWVSEDQILALLSGSGCDVVKALSEFCEHERDYFEEAKSCNSLMPSLDNSAAVYSDDCAKQKTVEKVLIGDLLQTSKQPEKVLVLTPCKSVSKSTKKRGSKTVSKPKKKAKSILDVQNSGQKQSTITYFFGRAAVDSQSSSKMGTIVHCEHKKNENELTQVAKEELEVGSTFDCGQKKNKNKPSLGSKEAIDQFLQIINGSMSRDSAAVLLEEARGDVNTAVDMFYERKNDSCIRSSDNDVNRSHINLDNYKKDDSASGSVFKTLNVGAQINPVDGNTSAKLSLSVENYQPMKHACWKNGEAAPYLHLARTFALVEQEKGKIKTMTMLCNMFRSLLALSPSDVLPAIYLCTNKIAPDHENVELNIGSSLVLRALEEALGVSKSKIKEMYKTFGDLGDVAQECRQNQSLLAPPRPLLIRDVFSTLRKMSAITGSGSTIQRKLLVLQLIRSCREMEIKYLVRMLVRNLRIGAMMKTILPALAHAVVLDCSSITEPAILSEDVKFQMQSISSEVAKAYDVVPNLDILVPCLLSKGITFSASSLEMLPGIPIPPMLARITNGLKHATSLLQGRAFTCEYKYDGQRAQIHKLPDGSVRIFSRQMKESTFRFPDLVNIVNELSDPSICTFILDAEVVAVDRRKGNKIMSFQELSSRERGSKESTVLIDNIKVDICAFVFDIMFCNGKRLLDISLRERRKYIQGLLREKVGFLEFAKEITVDGDELMGNNEATLSRISLFFEEACSSSCEGIMLKTLDADAGYSASKRSDSWLKVKRDYVEGLGDSLDLVPIGAWYGNGRKAGWYSPFLMACYNPETEEYQSVCRVMSGFSDAFYKEMKEFFSDDKVLPKKPTYYKTDELPNLWFPAELVWEIRGADLTVSPVHHAAIGLVHPSRGISVRMPRYIRSLPDRNPEDCSSASDIASMFKSQTRKMEVEGDEDET